MIFINDSQTIQECVESIASRLADLIVSVILEPKINLIPIKGDSRTGMSYPTKRKRKGIK
jgi:hypothetical protein